MKLLITIIRFILILIPSLGYAQKIGADLSETVYQSDALIIKRIGENVYVHTTFLKSETFGKVPCNGMLVKSHNEAVIFDTPADEASSAELINWIKKKLNCQIKAVIPAHFHEDCLGGLNEFNRHEIPSYANKKTIELAKANNYNIPTNSFEDSLILTVGNKKVYAIFMGEGHTKDNVVGYFPSENILFGGCLIKELSAGKGNLADANTKEWSETVEKVKNKYQQVKIVIPGHGEIGDKALLDYTIKLFQNN